MNKPVGTYNSVLDMVADTLPEDPELVEELKVQMERKKKLCFVYGTLKKGQCRGHIMNSATYIGPAKTVEGDFVLINCGAYPALAKSSTLKFKTSPMVVHGELYEIDNELMQVLDQIEGYPYLYTREEVGVDSGHVPIAYLYARPGEFKKNDVILTGVWTDSLSRRQ